MSKENRGRYIIQFYDGDCKEYCIYDLKKSVVVGEKIIDLKEAMKIANWLNSSNLEIK